MAKKILKKIFRFDGSNENAINVLNALYAVTQKDPRPFIMTQDWNNYAGDTVRGLDENPQDLFPEQGSSNYINLYDSGVIPTLYSLGLNGSGNIYDNLYKLRAWFESITTQYTIEFSPFKTSEYKYFSLVPRSQVEQPKTPEPSIIDEVWTQIKALSQFNQKALIPENEFWFKDVIKSIGKDWSKDFKKAYLSELDKFFNNYAAPDGNPKTDAANHSVDENQNNEDNSNYVDEFISSLTKRFGDINFENINSYSESLKTVYDYEKALLIANKLFSKIKYIYENKNSNGLKPPFKKNKYSEQDFDNARKKIYSSLQSGPIDENVQDETEEPTKKPPLVQKQNPFISLLKFIFSKPI